ncbi:MAG: type II toxin-antitoxin system HigB family toxin [Bacteroidales bacterium]|nr:type II toxin-antitoxin system HigB family toxin [Bacteroidales bacterium]
MFAEVLYSVNSGILSIGKQFLFNYRLVIVVMFTPGLVYIRWVGTHKEYDKIDCSTI